MLFRSPLHLIDPALHVNPDRLRKALQKAIDQEESRYSTHSELLIVPPGEKVTYEMLIKIGIGSAAQNQKRRMFNK